MAPPNPVDRRIVIQIPMHYVEGLHWIGCVNALTLHADDSRAGLWQCVGLNGPTHWGATILEFQRTLAPNGIVRYMESCSCGCFCRATGREIATFPSEDFRELIYGRRPTGRWEWRTDMDHWDTSSYGCGLLYRPWGTWGGFR